MLNKHPKGLWTASVANMGERFGFYTMIAILALFLQTKFNLTGTHAGIIYSVFYALLMCLSLVGGLIADKTRNYKGTILIGLLVMAVGYLLLSIPTQTYPMPNKTLGIAFSCGALLVIAFGNGLFKGNLQAVVGQMYDNEQYGKMRDSGFSLFYAFINIGAMFAPFAARGVRNWWLKSSGGFTYDANLPALCHQQLNGTITSEGSTNLARLAAEVSPTGANTADLTTFATNYLNTFTEGFHYAFIVAIAAMLLSTVVYLVNRSGYPDPKDKVKASAHSADVEMSLKEVRQRIWALMAVFSVVIFFWFGFNQSGLMLTFFARDYIDLSLFGMSLNVEDLQAVNPLLVVLLTPVIVSFYGWLNAKGIEPSTPKKIAIGMGIAASAFGLLALVSNLAGLPAHADVIAIHGGVSPVKVSVFVLIGTYFILTVAELFISPLGISFASKVAPPKYQGMMQGGWLAAAGIGNLCLLFGALFYDILPIWVAWTIFVGALLVGMFMMLFMLKWLEKFAK